MKLVSTLKKVIMEHQAPRYRSRRAFYASEVAKDARDIYWSLTGEPKTNPSDLLSKIRMELGSGIEAVVVKWLQAGTVFGLKFLGTQIPIGGSDPVPVDGYLDGLVEDEQGNKYAIEIKTKWGWGAFFFSKERDVGENWLAQMGYYLRDLNEKGITNKGIFLVLPFADESFGDLIAVYCRYDAATDTVIAYESQSANDETPRPHNFRVAMKPLLDKLVMVQECVKNGTLPPVDKVYKYPLTPEVLAEAKDSDIKKALEGTKVIGDFEIGYSDYKQLHMQLQGGAEYTEAELQLLAAENMERETRKRAATNAKRAATIAAKKKAG